MSLKRPSLKDVAKLAGVGLGTASRVLNESPSVKPETRERVLQAIKDLNYRPNNIARSLKMNSTFSIGVLLADLKSGFYSEIIRGIQDVAEKNGYSVFLTNTDKNKLRVINCIKTFVEKKVDGIIVIGSIIDEVYSDISDFQIPLISISCVTDIKPEGKFASITVDNIKASYEAVEYFINKGHTKIAMISGEKNEPNAGIPRIKGYKKALSDYNIPINEDWIIEGSYTYNSGYECANLLIQREDRPTAIFIASDAMAIGAIKAILEAGISIPDEIAIIGFDGLDFSEYVHPSLSTVYQPRYSMGIQAMETMLHFLSDEPIEISQIILNHKLIIRESC